MQWQGSVGAHLSYGWPAHLKMGQPPVAVPTANSSTGPVKLRRQTLDHKHSACSRVAMHGALAVHSQAHLCSGWPARLKMGQAPVTVPTAVSSTGLVKPRSQRPRLTALLGQSMQIRAAAAQQ